MYMYFSTKIGYKLYEALFHLTFFCLTNHPVYGIIYDVMVQISDSKHFSKIKFKEVTHGYYQI